MMSHLKGKGVVKKVVRGCCYAEWGSKRKTMLVLPDLKKYASYPWKRKNTWRLNSKTMNVFVLHK